MNNPDSKKSYGKQSIQILTVSHGRKQAYVPQYQLPINTAEPPPASKPYQYTSPHTQEQPSYLEEAPKPQVTNKPYVRNDIVRKEEVNLKPEQSAISEIPMASESPVSETLPLNRMGFCGILISVLTIIISLGCLVAGCILNFDKKGKEAYFIDDPDTEFTFGSIPYYISNNPNKVLKTDYWGWFQRSHDSDSSLKEYDVFYFVLIAAVVSGAYGIILGIVEIFKYKSNKVESATCVFLLLNIDDHLVLDWLYINMCTSCTSLLQIL